MDMRDSGRQAVGCEERRRYVRHPVDMPIQVYPQAVQSGGGIPLMDVGAGGLAFRTRTRFSPGSHLIVRIEQVVPVFEAVGVVRWCEQRDGGYEVGVQFLDEQTRFRARMVEQVCRIQSYRRQCLEEGRQLDFEEAAQEWIERFGASFDEGGNEA